MKTLFPLSSIFTHLNLTLSLSLPSFSGRSRQLLPIRPIPQFSSFLFYYSAQCELPTLDFTPLIGMILSLVPLIGAVPMHRWGLFIGEQITGLFSAEEIVFFNFHKLLGIIISSLLKRKAVQRRRRRRQNLVMALEHSGSR